MRLNQRYVQRGFLPWCGVLILNIFLITIVASTVVAFSRSADAFTVLFDQSGYSGDVWLQIQDPNYNSVALNNFVATYGGGIPIDFTVGASKVLMSAPVKLSAIGSGGLNITRSESAVFFVYYDDPTGNSRTAAPSHMVSTQRFQPFEVTMMGRSGDQGNLTAINYFTAPLSLKSYVNSPLVNPSEPVVQETGFGTYTASQIGALLASATGGSASAVKKNAKGQIVRYLGPSNYNGTNPWPSFVPYTQSIHAASQTTHIKRTNGFNFPSPPTPVYQFGADMTATANADGSLTVAGDLTVSVNAPITPGNPELPLGGVWSGATITFSVSDVDVFNNAIYGQIKNDAVTYSGGAFDSFKTFTQNTLRDPTKPHKPDEPDSNKSLYDLGAYNTTLSMIIGEITTGLLGGFFNSDYKTPSMEKAIKNMDSNDWWSLNPIVAYSTIQPLHKYYNIYAQVIFDKSNNTVYGVPYSDRFGQGPLVNTVLFDGKSINYWKVGIGAPLSAANATAGTLELLLLDGN